MFPYRRIIVRVRRTNGDSPALQTALDGIGARLRTRLEEMRCEVPHTLDVRAECVQPSADEWTDDQLFSIQCEREEAEPVMPPDPRRRSSLRVAVVQGAATQEAYRFDEPAVYIGRSVEVADRSGRVRRNHVAFLDSIDGITETVGRAHACFRLNDQTGECRIFDEGSSNGTWVVRRGATLFVPPRDPRGVRVESGDEVRIGRALIRVSVEAE